ncbi:MAG: EF2563 family selenium-dependent molybdenum hydroxylase system protein [Acidobacteriia bacterium]|nr:EF2563 family selenium-dependent molybdenum hydroxylase system protein [Terriglobia bacterium]
MDGFILIRGAGEMASGVAHKLWRCGIKTVLTEIGTPLAIRRGVAFAEVIYTGSHRVEDLDGHRVTSLEEAKDQIGHNHLPVIVDPELKLTAVLLQQSVAILVDARMLKAPVAREYPRGVHVIGLGPGFDAPSNADYVIETNRGHHLGRVIEKGSAEGNTGVPTEVQGASNDRVVYPLHQGVFLTSKKIGDSVKAGDIIGSVKGIPVKATLTGVLRGLVHEGTPVTDRTKVADIDPRGNPENCFLISDKARAIAGGVLEAVLRILNSSSN